MLAHGDRLDMANCPNFAPTLEASTSIAIFLALSIVEGFGLISADGGPGQMTRKIHSSGGQEHSVSQKRKP